MGRRRLRADPGVVPAHRIARAACRRARLGRIRDLHGGAGEPGLRPDRVEPAVVHRRPRARLPRRGGGAARPLHYAAAVPISGMGARYAMRTRSAAALARARLARLLVPFTLDLIAG